MEKTYLVIDIGGTFIKYGLINDQQELSQLDKLPTPASLGEFLKRLTDLIASFASEIKGVGISCPGQINTQNGFVHHGGLIPYLKQFPLGTYLETETLFPVSILNDGDAAGLAEARYGRLSDVSCGAALVLGTGVGGALLVDGELLSLKQVQTGSLLSKLQISQNQPKLAENGFLAILASVSQLYAHGLESLRTNAGSAVQFVERASQEMGLDKADGQEVFQALLEGQSPSLQALFEHYCHEIAYLILNLQSIFKLERLVIGGGISSQPLLLEEINRQYQVLLEGNSQFADLFEPIPILACRYHNQANLLGAYCQLKDKLEQPLPGEKDSLPGIFSWLGEDKENLK